MGYQETVARLAVDLAQEIGATALLVLTETGASYDLVLAHKPKIPIIAASVDEETFQQLVKKAMINTLDIEFLDLEERAELVGGERDPKLYALKLMTRGGRSLQVEDAVAIAMNKGILREGDLLVILGSTISGEADQVSIYEVRKDRLTLTLFDLIRGMNIKQEVFEAVLNIALEIGREGREGRLIGTSFLLGDGERVLENSRQLIINPFKGHRPEERAVTNPQMKETIKALAQLDGAMVIDSEGICQAAGRYLNVDTGKVDIPRGLGARHAAVASMTAATDAIGVTVSQSGGIVRIFKKGKVIMTIEPQKKFSVRTEALRGSMGST